jgi:hypothetical protein
MITALMTVRIAMEIMWNREVTRTVQKKLHQMNAAMKCTLLTFVFIGQFKKKWCIVKYSTHIKSRWQNILIITWDYWSSRASHYAHRNMELPVKNEILDKIF